MSIAAAVRTPELVSIVDSSTAMGGRLVLRATTQAGREAEARREMRIAGDRVRAWAAMLTRRGEDSDLVRLNRDPRPEVPVGPTLAAALSWARDAGELTGGIVDPTLLDERLAAERAGGGTRAARRRGRRVRCGFADLPVVASAHPCAGRDARRDRVRRA